MPRYYPQTMAEFEALRAQAVSKYQPLLEKLSGPELVGLSDAVHAALKVENAVLHTEGALTAAALLAVSQRENR